MPNVVGSIPTAPIHQFNLEGMNMPAKAKTKPTEIDQLKSKLRSKPPVESPPKWLSTGSTLVNLACSGRTTKGLIGGHYYLFWGDSNSGKSWLVHSCLAEASINKEFDDYRLIYDNPEDGALMDLKRYFGTKLAERIEPPATNKGSPAHSNTIEDFYYNLDDAANSDKPFIYVLDSMDSLTTEDDQNKFQESKAAKRKGKETTGSYGMSKAKKNSSGIRETLHKLKEKKSILIIVAQSRTNIGFGSQFNPKTRAGGLSLKFYASCELNFSIREQIKKRVAGKDRQLGILSKVHIIRTRLTGKDRTVEIPIYHSHGIDDIGSCVDYLVEEKYWKEKDGEIDAPDFNFKGSMEKLVQKIEEENREKELRSLVLEKWNDIESQCEVNRKKRYV